MRVIVHICLADAEPPCSSSVSLPGGIVARVYWRLTEGGSLDNHSLLPIPGITYECASFADAADVLRRELNDVPYLM